MHRWEFGQVGITAPQAVPSGTYQGAVQSIAQISGHLSDTTTTPGRLDSWKQRSIDIGGFVFCSNTFLNQAPVPSISAHAIVYHVLYTDRLDGSGAPFVIPDFSINTPPTLAATFATGANETTFPQKILWRETRVLPIGANDNGVGHPQAYYAGSRSLRLRLRLTDSTGLFFCSGIVQSTGTTAGFTTILSGSLYWRARY